MKERNQIDIPLAALTHTAGGAPLTQAAGEGCAAEPATARDFSKELPARTESALTRAEMSEGALGQAYLRVPELADSGDRSCHTAAVIEDLTTEPVRSACARGDIGGNESRRGLARLRGLTAARGESQKEKDVALARCASPHSGAWPMARTPTVDLRRLRGTMHLAGPSQQEPVSASDSMIGSMEQP
jgi:hypothetical protein